MASVGLLSILLLLALVAVGGTITVLLVRRRSPDQPRSRASRIGCVIVAILGLAIVGLSIRQLQQDSRLLGDPEIQVSAVGAELFLGDRFVGRDTVLWTEPPPEMQPYPTTVTYRELVDRLFPGAEVLDYDESQSVHAWGTEIHFQVTIVEVSLRHPDGRLDSVQILMPIRDRPGSIVVPSPDAFGVLRARDGDRRTLQLVGTLGVHQHRTLLDLFLRIERPPRFELTFDLRPTPSRLLREGETPVFYVDGLEALPAEAEPDAGSAPR